MENWLTIVINREDNPSPVITKKEMLMETQVTKPSFVLRWATRSWYTCVFFSFMFYLLIVARHDYHDLKQVIVMPSWLPSIVGTILGIHLVAMCLRK